MSRLLMGAAGGMWLSATLLLGGCASENKLAASGVGTSPIVTPYEGPPVALRRAVGPVGKNRRQQYSLGNIDNNNANSVLAYFNAQRAELGLPSIEPDDRVAEAARAHARYLAVNDEASHREQPENRHFTGVDVADRLSIRLPVNGASEVLTRYGGSFSDENAIRDVFASPYHRGVILFDWQLGGAALQRANASVIVVDFANIRPTLAPNEMVAYPYDGQADVPTTWTDNEVPDPLGEDSRYRGQKVGFPVTLSGGPNAHIAWRRATLTDASGRTIPCQIAPIRPADNARNTAICTPLVPLHTQTLYRMDAVGTLTQLSRFTTIAPFSLRWSFTTAE